MMPLTANLVTVYQVDDTDGDRRHTPKYFLQKAEAMAYQKEGGGYRSYAGEKKAIAVLDEDDNDSKSYFLVEDITMKMSHVNVKKLREQAIAKLTRVERVALGISED